MTSQMNSTRRPASAQKSGTGLKALIMAASVGITLGGWGILAVGQTQNANAAAPQSQAYVQAVSPATQTGSRGSNSSTFQSQPAAPLVQPRAITRTRSSR